MIRSRPRVSTYAERNQHGDSRTPMGFGSQANCATAEC
ncbi:hypothetical protein Poly24_28530 [Rosistilla carotiformis]|uniref:Uncharacterized protein n=1 Tax=Rosistilla carotiformis TaxID=2528017 RepID=A0A518JUA9_9BACT|nr:hypothetical protein Poly24_28530 [Rosistilla carotiformis]